MKAKLLTAILIFGIMLSWESTVFADTVNDDSHITTTSQASAERIAIKGLEGYYISNLPTAESKDTLIITNENGEQVSKRAYKYISDEVGLGGTIEVSSNYSDNKQLSVDPEEEYNFKGLIDTDFNEILPCLYYRFSIEEVNDVLVIFVPAEGGVNYFDINGNSIDENEIYDFVGLTNIDCSDWAKDTVKKSILMGIVPESLQGDYTNNITREEFCNIAMEFYIEVYEFLNSADVDTEYKSVLESKPFVDCDSPNVALAHHLGIVSGTGDYKFSPDKLITRQEAAVLLTNFTNSLYKFANNSISPRAAAFYDENEFAPWAKDAIYNICGTRKFGSESIMTGTGDNKFSPLANYTREQAIATIYRIAAT